jgi:hypothetical protein
MSNEIQTVELPDYLKEMTGEADKASSMISGASSVPRVSIRGRQFRFIEDGEEVHKQTDPINVIIMGVVPEHAMAKTFYLNGYQPGSSDPPDCSSWDGIKPDTWCESPQSDVCANCQQNVWGSAKSMSGKKAKACKDSKRLAIVNAKDHEGQMYIFNVTIASLKALSEYGKFLVSNHVPMAAAITQIAFVDSEFPQVEFKFGGVLGQEIGTKMLERAERAEWVEATGTLPAPAKESTPKIVHTETTSAPDAMVEKSKSVDDLLNNWG